jgi:ribosomal protein S15
LASRRPIVEGRPYRVRNRVNILGAVMSEKIISLMAYVKRFPKDFKSGKALTHMVQKRRKMLNYLMRTDYHYYKWVCAEYGIPEAFPLYAHHKTHFRGKVNALQGI